MPAAVGCDILQKKKVKNKKINKRKILTTTTTSVATKQSVNPPIVQAICGATECVCARKVADRMAGTSGTLAYAWPMPARRQLAMRHHWTSIVRALSNNTLFVFSFFLYYFASVVRVACVACVRVAVLAIIISTAASPSYHPTTVATL